MYCGIIVMVFTLYYGIVNMSDVPMHCVASVLFGCQQWVCVISGYRWVCVVARIQASI